MIDLTDRNNMSNMRYQCKDAVTNYLNSFGFKIEETYNEFQVRDYFKTTGVEFKTKKLTPVAQKLKFGDSIIKLKKYENFTIDIRFGTFISKKSLEQYKGDYYILTPKGDISEEGIKNAMVIKNSTIKSYFQPVREDRMAIGPSGTKGYRFNRIKNFMRLEDFIIELAKVLLQPNINQAIKELNLSFNKVKGTRIPYKEFPGRFRG